MYFCFGSTVSIFIKVKDSNKLVTFLISNKIVEFFQSKLLCICDSCRNCKKIKVILRTNH